MIFSLLIPVIVSATKSPDCLVLRVILYASKTALRTASSSGALCASGGRRAKSFKRPYFQNISTIQAETSHAASVVSVCGTCYAGY